MKLFAAILVFAAIAAVVFAAHATKPQAPPELNALERCGTGGVDLIDERCNADGCARQSIRLEWAHGSGALFENDGTGERERRRIQGAELSGLMRGLGGLERRHTDSDLQCGSVGCPSVDRALTIGTQCDGHAQTFTFIRARPAWERVRSDCTRFDGTEAAQCVADRAWHTAFATTLAERFGTAFKRLQESARGG